MFESPLPNEFKVLNLELQWVWKQRLEREREKKKLVQKKCKKFDSANESSQAENVQRRRVQLGGEIFVDESVGEVL